MHKLILGAFENQDKLNQRVNPDWKAAGYPWHRALWTEVGEALQPLNWVWWRKGMFGQPMTEQQRSDLQLEMCDAFHFGLSMDIIEAWKGNDPSLLMEHRAGLYIQMFGETRQTDPVFYTDIEKVAAIAIMEKRFDIEHFARACFAIRLSLPRLLVWYYAKSTLNHFRQNNGYNLPKDDMKAYRKMWLQDDGGVGYPPRVEDNHHLAQLVGGLLKNNGDDALIDALSTGELQLGLTSALQKRYDKFSP